MSDAELKPGNFCFRDPKSLQPHPISAALYSESTDDWGGVSKQMTSLEAANEIMERMDIGDLLDSIKRDGIRVSLVVTPEGFIISGCRRWKVANILGLTSVPVEARAFDNETEEKQAIIDYNRYRDKTFSQKMRESDLIKEIASTNAKRKMLAGKKDPTPILGEGADPKRHARETKALVGSRIGMGTETFRKAEQIWNKAKQGDPNAVALVSRLDQKTTNTNAALNILKKTDKGMALPQLSKLQLAEPIGDGPICTCQTCGKSYRLVHPQSGKHRLSEIIESEPPILRLQQQIKIS